MVMLPADPSRSIAAPLLRPAIVALLLMALPFAVGTAVAQENPSFELIEPGSSQPAEWYTGGEAFEIAVDSATAYEGARSLRMKRVALGGFGVATQTVAPDTFAGERARLSGYIRTEAVEEGYAGFWVRVDGAERRLALDNMSGRGATETTPWTRYEIEVPVPQEAERIIFGALMPGAGTAWFDALELELLRYEDLPPPSDSATAYLESALDLMQEHTVNRDAIDWEAFREAALLQARGAETPADTYPALRYAIDKLGDHHSFLMTPERSGHDHDDEEDVQVAFEGSRAPHGALLTQGVAYLRVPGFGGSAKAATAFADTLQHLIARLDAQAPCGWIVDLRTNTGGNMWPMLAGLGPILGEGDVGTFVGPDGNQTDWWYRDGQAGLRQDTPAGAGATPAAEVSREPYQLQRPRPPVAVLTGPRTASSGEAMAVAFRGRPQTRSFGQATAGLSTSNQGFLLSDGARLLLTTATFADRDGTLYGTALEPDVPVPPQDGLPPLPEDAVVEAAQSWLDEQGGC